MHLTIYNIFTAVLLWHFNLAAMATNNVSRQSPVCLMYLTGQHDLIPEDPKMTDPITHVVLAFLRSTLFLEDERTEWPLFRTVEATREHFSPDTQVLVAIGGWGDNGFAEAAKDDSSRKVFAQNIAKMVKDTGADGIDVDWEYPGGNGEDYKQVPNSAKAWEIEAYPLLLDAIRAALGPSKLMTAAVPGLERDMLAFTDQTVPHIMENLDFLNVMTYDLMNRRDTVTKHHSSIQGSREALQAYVLRGAPAEKLNLGLAFYVKWFKTDAQEECGSFTLSASPVGCKTQLLEDPTSGADLGRAGGFSWHDKTPSELEESFLRAQSELQYDKEKGASYYWDTKEQLWWTFDVGSNGDIVRKVRTLRGEMNLAGVFAYGLGEDGVDFHHLDQLLAALREEGENESVHDEL
ncbi:glycoside hydrolase family 18 protein [Coniella lustricola]|uniref:chitinase n=1 Tax=Coniella lustricola TaxID=2025994 RepID=A0A2T3AGB0_9PEZI|nr:glycoside hydrolase family 18 protein [Coniella lustricola]